MVRTGIAANAGTAGDEFPRVPDVVDANHRGQRDVLRPGTEAMRLPHPLGEAGRALADFVKCIDEAGSREDAVLRLLVGHIEVAKHQRRNPRRGNPHDFLNLLHGHRVERGSGHAHLGWPGMRHDNLRFSSAYFESGAQVRPSVGKRVTLAIGDRELAQQPLARKTTRVQDAIGERAIELRFDGVGLLV